MTKFCNLIICCLTALSIFLSACRKPSSEDDPEYLRIQVVDLITGYPIEGAEANASKCLNYNFFTNRCEGGYKNYPVQYSNTQGIITVPNHYSLTVLKEKYWGYSQGDISDWLYGGGSGPGLSQRSNISSTGFTLKMAPVSCIKVVIQRTTAASYADSINLKYLVYTQGGVQYPNVDTAFINPYFHYYPVELNGDTTIISNTVGDYLTELKYSLIIGNTNSGILHTPRKNCPRGDTTTFLINY